MNLLMQRGPFSGNDLQTDKKGTPIRLAMYSMGTTFVKYTTTGDGVDYKRKGKYVMLGHPSQINESS